MIYLSFLNGKLKGSSEEVPIDQRFPELEAFDQHFTFSKSLTPRFFLELHSPSIKIRAQDSVRISYLLDNKKILRDEKRFWIILDRSAKALNIRLVLNGNKKVFSRLRLYWGIYVKPGASPRVSLEVLNLGRTILDLRTALRLARGSSPFIHIHIYNNYVLEGRVILVQSVSLGARSTTLLSGYLEHEADLRLVPETLLLGSRTTTSLESRVVLGRGQGRVLLEPRILSLESEATVNTWYRYLYPSGLRLIYSPQIECLTEKARVHARLETQ